MIIGDAAGAFRHLAPMAFAEASAHALVAQYAIEEVTAAARQAYMHRLPRIWPPCFAGFRNRGTDGCGGTGLCCRWGRRDYRCRHLRHRPLAHAWALRGGNGHRALTRACALRCLGVASGNRRHEDGSGLGFHRLRLHRHRHNRRRCGLIVLSGNDRWRGDLHHVGHRRIDAIRGIDARDQDRRDGSQAPARSQHLGHPPCRDAHVAWCCPRRRRVSGRQR